MRAIVATIAKDEEKFVKRWAASAEGADALVVGDTGSSDDTVGVALRAGARVHELQVRPWRFDDARNALLALLPDWEDAVVLTVDMDEVLVPGWRQALEQAHERYLDARRWSYHYVWSWVEPGVPDVQFTADRCHSRYGWRWHGAVHEVLQPAGDDQMLRTGAVPAGFRVEHYADDSKPRSQYLGLLEVAVREEPHNPRQRFYLAREQFFVGHWGQARERFVEYLQMPEATWTAERAEAYRYLAKMDDDPERWLIKALAEAPERRDAAVDLADLYAKQGRRTEAAGMAARALRVRARPGDYMTTARVWDDARLRAMAEEVSV